MKTSIIFIILLLFLILCGCITEYEAKIEGVEGILVVEGIITDDESVIILSRSAGLNHDDTQDMSVYGVPDAKVYVECDDGSQWDAEFHPDWDWGIGRGNGSRYTIATMKLNPERQYRLIIEMDEHIYCSEFAYPMLTPEIDSVFWTKKSKGQPVDIHVATHVPDNMVQYCRWSYREDWEYRSAYYDKNYACYCSNKYLNNAILIGTNEKNINDRMIVMLTKILPSDQRLSCLYRIDFKQNTISKQAFKYYPNSWGYVLRRCFDCTVDGGIDVEPDDWPKEFQNYQ